MRSCEEPLDIVSLHLGLSSVHEGDQRLEVIHMDTLQVDIDMGTSLVSRVSDDVPEEGAGGTEDELVGLDGAVIVTGQSDVRHLLILHQLSVVDNMILSKLRVLQNQTLRIIHHDKDLDDLNPIAKTQ